MGGDEGERAAGAVDAVALSRLWDERWPALSKLPYELRGAKDRWVRFHALPESKRYPGSEAEYETILARHNTVLAELVTGPTLLVATAGYSDSQQPEKPETAARQPNAAYWASACMEEESWLHLYVSQQRWSPGCLDSLLRQVADEVIGNVLLADPDLRWLYHPYDGGMDVILPSTADRDALRSRHHVWLSAHPAGL